MKNTEMLIPQGQKQEAENILGVLAEMEETEKRDLLMFLRGVALGKELAGKAG